MLVAPRSPRDQTDRNNSMAASRACEGLITGQPPARTDASTHERRRSLIRSAVLRPLATLVTGICDTNGSVLCAVVIAYVSEWMTAADDGTIGGQSRASWTGRPVFFVGNFFRGLRVFSPPLNPAKQHRPGRISGDQHSAGRDHSIQLRSSMPNESAGAKPLLPGKAVKLSAIADDALEEARRLPPGPERSEALKRAGQLRKTADDYAIVFPPRGRPKKT